MWVEFEPKQLHAHLIILGLVYSTLECLAAAEHLIFCPLSFFLQSQAVFSFICSLSFQLPWPTELLVAVLCLVLAPTPPTFLIPTTESATALTLLCRAITVTPLPYPCPTAFLHCPCGRRARHHRRSGLPPATFPLCPGGKEIAPPKPKPRTPVR